MSNIINSFLMSVGFCPGDIVTKAWWDCADTSMITEVANAASQVNDKGTTGLNHLIQATAGNKFTTNTRTLGGLNVLDSDGNDYMMSTSSPVPSSGDVMFIGVNVVDSNTAVGSSLWSCEAGTRNFQYQADGSSNFNGAIDAAGTAAIGSDIGGDGPVNGPSVYCTLFDFADATEYNSFVDGIANTNGPTTYNNKVNDASNFGVFINRNVSQFINGAFAELVITEDVTTDTRQKLEGYLAWKWDGGAAGVLVGKLDSGHPYKNSAP